MTKRSESPFDDSPTKKSKHTHIIHDGDPKSKAKEAPFLKLFAAPTPNGQKVFILLELLGTEYIYRSLNIKEESKTEWYLRINPAGKIPTILDVDSTGEQIVLAESGAILLYLASKYDTEHEFSYAEGTPNHWKEVEFILFHASGLNPEQKYYNITKTTEPENEFAISRFTTGIERAYQLFEDTLASNKNGWIIGDHISLADIIAYPHASGLKDSGFDTSKWPHLEKWLTKVGELDAVKSAMAKQ